MVRENFAHSLLGGSPDVWMALHGVGRPPGDALATLQKRHATGEDHHADQHDHAASDAHVGPPLLGKRHVAVVSPPGPEVIASFGVPDDHRPEGQQQAAKSDVEHRSWEVGGHVRALLAGQENDFERSLVPQRAQIV